MQIFATVSGSFNKSLADIFNKVAEFESKGVTILSPRIADVKERRNGFIVLEGDEGSAADIELSHLGAISHSDFLYVMNPDGYVGRSVALEIGYALARGIPIFSFESPKENVFSSFIKSQLSVEQIIDVVSRTDPSLKQLSSISDMQKYVQKMVYARGFQNETLEQVMLLLTEEIGELAKAVRTATGIKVGIDEKKRYKTIDLELADCLIYILDLANLASIDLQRAFSEKERLNDLKVWGTKKDLE